MKRRYDPLGAREQRFLCEYIAGLVPVAADRSDGMRDTAVHLISTALSRWTADGVERGGGLVKRDVLKHDFTLLPHTPRARTLIEGGRRGARHEHVVPRTVLAERIRDERMEDPERLGKFLRTYCIAVLVTKDETDELIWPRRRMPDGFSWVDGDPWDRCRTELKELLTYPRLEAPPW